VDALRQVVRSRLRATTSTLTAMRLAAGLLAVIVALAPGALRAQHLELAPLRADRLGPLPNGGWCFGVRLRSRDRCTEFFLLELGARFRTSGATDHSTRDPAHAYPTLGDHAYLGLGLAHRIGEKSALGGIVEGGAGSGERLSLGARFDQQLGQHLRIDVGGGAMRAETHQRGVTGRRNANGMFIDGAIRASDLAVFEARFDHLPGDGQIVKPANATYVGMRVEGTGAVKTTIAGAAIVSVLLIIVFLGGGGGD
jgi:hypothetical protein